MIKKTTMGAGGTSFENLLETVIRKSGGPMPDFAKEAFEKAGVKRADMDAIEKKALGSMESRCVTPNCVNLATDKNNELCEAHRFPQG